MMKPRRMVGGWDYSRGDFYTLLMGGVVYVVSFSGPAYLLWCFRSAHPLFLMMLAIGGWLLAALVFVVCLVLIKRVFIGDLPYGRYLLASSKVRRWAVATKACWLMKNSPFRALVNDYYFFRLLYYRGMGARVDHTVLFAQRINMTEPWAITIGRHTTIGEEAIIAGHKIERDVLTLGEVEIGNHVLIGVRALIFPGVKIGDGAMIGAYSVVVRGTTIPPGETWAGNPARKVELLERVDSGLELSSGA